TFDLRQQERLPLNFSDVLFRLNMADASFGFHVTNNSTDRPKFTIVNATLHLQKKKLFADCESGILQALGNETVKYFFTETRLRHRLIEKGSSTFYFDNLFTST